jgi:5-methylcytosine-specific restriction endonuclease McrA
MENFICEYRCGQKANFILKNGKHCCSKSSNSCIEVRKNNSNKQKVRHREGRAYKIPKEVSDRGRETRKKFLLSLPFEKQGRRHKREIILKEQGGKCLICGLNEWLGKSLVLELDHIDGNNNNDIRENLRLLCPNCHSQTDTWKKGGVAKQKRVTDEKLIKALKENNTIRDALKSIGLNNFGGANYYRAKALKENLKHNI